DVLIGSNKGTKLYEQEILGLMLDEDNEGVLWQVSDIAHAIMTDESKMRVPLRMIGVDPSVSANPGDECGIVVAGTHPGMPLHKRQAFVLEDASMQGTPEQWAERVVEKYHEWGAAGVVVEKNQGDHLLTMALKSVDASVKIYPVHAKLSKALRADPVAQRYQQGRVFHTEVFPELETQMTTWQPAVSKK